MFFPVFLCENEENQIVTLIFLHKKQGFQIGKLNSLCEAQDIGVVELISLYDHQDMIQIVLIPPVRRPPALAARPRQRPSAARPPSVRPPAASAKGGSVNPTSSDGGAEYPPELPLDHEEPDPFGHGCSLDHEDY